MQRNLCPCLIMARRQGWTSPAVMSKLPSCGIQRMRLQRKGNRKRKSVYCVRGVVSPILMNVFLHHVLDLWIEQMVKPHCQGRVVLYRFADDALIVCASERDARRIQATLPKRCAKYGLSLIHI